MASSTAASVTATGSQGITVTRALVELKTLDKRITKAIDEAVFIDWHVPCQEKSLSKVEKSESSLQQIRDLIHYRDRLKRAIVLSNAQTHVTINGRDYTVAEAIEHKSSIEYLQRLLNRMKSQSSSVQNEVERHNQGVSSRLDRLLEREFGKDNVSSNVGNLDTITSTFLQRQNAKVVDPLKVEGRIDTLSSEIDEFLKEVDLTLSESNATTRIHV